MAIIKDDTIDQIPLFELPQPQKPTEKPMQVPADTGEKRLKIKESARKAVPPRVREEKTKGASRTARREKPTKALPAVPEGDVRLTANIRQELHLKLKIAAATRRTTIGELIEDLVAQYL